MKQTKRISGYLRRQPNGVGYVVIPTDVDREDFIKNCKRRKQVSILTEDMELIHNVRITNEAMNNVVFPERARVTGTPVIWSHIPPHSIPIITGTLDFGDSYPEDIDENSYSISKKNGKNFAKIKINAKKSSISLSTNSDDEDIKSMLDIKILSANNDAKMDVLIQGKTNFESSEEFNLKTNKLFEIVIQDKDDKKIKTTINYKLGTGLTIEDEFNNKIQTNNEKNIIISNKDNGEIQFTVLGKTNEEVLNDINDNLTDLINKMLIQLTTDGVILTGLGLTGFATLAAQLPEILIELNKIKLNIPNTKSKTLKIN